MKKILIKLFRVVHNITSFGTEVDIQDCSCSAIEPYNNFLRYVTKRGFGDITYTFITFSETLFKPSETAVEL